MIEVEALGKRFGNVTAVDGVSFSAADARITGLLGPNGAGKSTTLRTLYTVVKPDSGAARVDGHDVCAAPLQVRRCLGVLPHGAGLYPRLSARENIAYFGKLAGLRGQELQRRIDTLVDMLEMAEFQHRRAKGYSQGQRIKTALARALVHSPKNIVLDEPTNGLDVMATRALRELIRRLRQEGHCVLFSSHVMQEVAALCDDIIIIARGQVVASGSPDALRAQFQEQDLEEVFVRAIQPLEAKP
ncbi:ABC transporter ATP-binding protein [Kineobactrum salinum]|uniref:ATP-binding cassette domain-containing protein n=1 Tax=Kineobactrum salinum TaxID=2708301 RepID=A0A6C0TY08_9GAMM|nr:ATP-binding cassette domain-containing protein [Kineobactrum salinum]QIB64681.1 ATP-binding cassette domain-containing protein [Kineobactrum salinum]